MNDIRTVLRNIINTHAWEEYRLACACGVGDTGKWDYTYEKWSDHVTNLTLGALIQDVQCVPIDAAGNRWAPREFAAAIAVLQRDSSVTHIVREIRWRTDWTAIENLVPTDVSSRSEES